MQLSVAASSNLALTPGALGAAAAAGAALHLLFLAANTAAAGALRFAPDARQDTAIRRAVVLCTSEKTLPVAVAVINQLAAAGGGAAGLAVVPCVLAHLAQIAIDSALVGRWNRQDAAALAAEAAGRAAS
jgi:sodium/bile acid cotransporter 7